MIYKYNTITVETAHDGSMIAVLHLLEPIARIEGNFIDSVTNQAIFKENVTELKVHESIFCNERYSSYFQISEGSDGWFSYYGDVLSLQLSKMGNVWITDLVFGIPRRK